mmetsp:Transcript_16075/g.25028  ORF Transcript_16075/g.25028 Transcript_16075/m.25028 type:complete len:986 (-) Transcript_16075:85-3042(-)
MSTRRVSSRPRLVSDADRASQISVLDTENNYSDFFFGGQDDDDDVNLLTNHHGNGNGDGNHHHGSLGQITSSSGEVNDDDGRKSVIPAVLITGDDDNDDNEKKSHVVVTTRRTPLSFSTANNDKKQIIIMTSSISDDTLSDYASCCLYHEEEDTTALTSSNNLLQRESNPSLFNLEMSFQKTSLSSNEDYEGGMEEAAAAAYMDRQLLTATSSSATTTTKRKRLSQQHSSYYLTPNSSYAELQQQQNNMMWYSPLSSSSSSSSPVRHGVVGQSSIVSRKLPYHHHLSTTTTSCAPTTTLLPEETLINITTHLTHNDIRSFASTCHSIRMVVMTSTCAVETLWMERLRCSFPVVFGLMNDDGDGGDMNSSSGSSGISDGGSGGGGSGRMMHSSNINFVDDFELPLAAAREGFGINSSSSSSSRSRNTVNLPLLTGLLASRYPQKINLHGIDSRASIWGGGVDVPFRSFDMAVPRATAAAATPTTVASPIMMDNEDDDDDDVVSVIQFTGTVGTGDRSIRSDKPFPPNCRAIASSNSSSGSSSSSNTGASLKSLSTWMKNHTPLRSRGNKRKNGRGASAAPTHSMVRDLSPPPTPRYHHRQFLMTSSLSNSNSNLPLHRNTRRGLQHLPLTSHSSSKRSPLFRFLSSLSHHCDCVSNSNTSSYHNEADDLDDIDSNTSMEQNHSGNDDDVDEIGVNDYGMMHIRHNGNGLLEQCRQKLGYNKSIKNNNLRPFVIPTVLSSSPGEGVTVDVTPGLVAYFEVTIIDQRDEGSRANERQVPQQPQPPHHDGIGHRGYLPRPRRRNIPFGGHHRVFLRLDSLAGQLAVARNIVDQHQQLPQHLHHDPNDNAANNIMMRPRPQRHECVAIGLSTLSFNPRSRMPGWDEHSFGYHGDDGGIFHGHGDMLRRYGPSFGPGDTVGCGLDYSTRKIFFVKNGDFLGWAFENVDVEMVDRGLYPTVGIDTECPVLVNFGKLPFKFDLKEFGREKLYM